MERFLINLTKNQSIQIDKRVFVDLLEITHIKDYKSYELAITANEISFKDLKNLAIKAGVPYPLFFAPIEIVKKQIEDKNKHLYEKIPSKKEIQLNSRGSLEIKDIELIVKDLGRKQEFLKNRVLKQADINHFVGCIAGKVKANAPYQEIANEIRTILDIDLNYLRTLSKEKVRKYIVSCVEKKGVLVSFSSYNYMPQNIDPKLEVSGICIKDKKFPIIFINTRDGDEKPKIIESDGRQIFTLLSMIACIGMGKFLLSSKGGKPKGNSSKLAYAIASEIIVPLNDILDVSISTMEELKQKAHFFKVTPSMLLYKINEHKRIKNELATSLRQQLQKEVKSSLPSKRKAPLPTTGYGKYNGQRFSKEILDAYRSGKISQVEVKNILFRRGKMDTKIFIEYSKKYK